MQKPNVTFFSERFLVVLHILFFLSGVAGLIYQIIWQRMLFNIYGTDLESITIIVSVFMFGLGIGGLIGGYLADKFVSKLLFLYVLAELTIAFYGFFSPTLISEIAGYPAIQSCVWLTFFTSYLILFLPTTLMGATFPILVRQVSMLRKNIGHSVGELYFSNTIGGAVGALLTGFGLLSFLDTMAVIYTAVFINIIITLTAVIAFGRN